MPMRWSSFKALLATALLMLRNLATSEALCNVCLPKECRATRTLTWVRWSLIRAWDVTGSGGAFFISNRLKDLISPRSKSILFSTSFRLCTFQQLQPILQGIFKILNQHPSRQPSKPSNQTFAQLHFQDRLCIRIHLKPPSSSAVPLIPNINLTLSRQTCVTTPVASWI